MSRALDLRPSRLGASLLSSGMLLAPLIPSRDLEHQHLLSERSAEVEKILLAVPGVSRARVQLSIPYRDSLRPHRELPDATAAVLLVETGSTPPLGDDQIRALVAGAAAEVTPARISVVRTREPAPAAPDRALAGLGPVQVARESLPLLRWIFGAWSLLTLLLLAALVAVRMQARRLVPKDD